MTKKTKILWGVFITFVFLFTTGFTYAYFSLSVTGNDEATTIEVGATTLSLTYADTLVLTGTNIEPGWEQSKTLTVRNSGTEGAAYNIGWQQILNQITNDELLIEGSCSTSVTDSSCDSISSQVVPTYSSVQTATSGSLIYALKEGIYIDVGETHTYTIKVKFKETSSAQNYNQGKAFSGTLGIVASGATTTVTVNISDGTDSITTGISGTIYSNPITGTLTDGKLVFNNVPVGNHTLSLTVGGSTYTKPIAVGLSETEGVSSVNSGVRTKIDSKSTGVEISATITNSSISNIEVIESTLAPGLYQNGTLVMSWDTIKSTYPAAFATAGSIVGTSSSSYLTSLSGDLYIGDDITTIGERAFRKCTSVTSVVIPDSVTTIGTYAFDDCTSLTSVVIPDSVTTIGTYAFSDCTSLTSVVIPDSVTTIGQDAFGHCSALTSVTIPDSVTSIGMCAFQMCSSLSSVTLGSGLTEIGNDVFNGCTSLTSIIIPDGVTKIRSYAFAYCPLASITLPDSITSIEGYTFVKSNTPNVYTTSSSVAALLGEYDFAYDTDPSGTVAYVYLNGSLYSTLVHTYSCFLPGTMITLADGSRKAIEDITYDDKLLVWNFDEGKYDTAGIAWLTKTGLKNDHYYKLTFSDGTVLKTTGVNSNHKIYNVDERIFKGVDKTEVGDRIFSENGIVTVTNKEYIEEEVKYYNLMTEGTINCFANGILASDRYGNMYEIDSDMKYIKDGRIIKPYIIFEKAGISKYWYDKLRLGEQSDSLEKIKEYINKCESQMRQVNE